MTRARLQRSSRGNSLSHSKCISEARNIFTCLGLICSSPSLALLGIPLLVRVRFTSSAIRASVAMSGASTLKLVKIHLHLHFNPSHTASSRCFEAFSPCEGRDLVCSRWCGCGGAAIRRSRLLGQGHHCQQGNTRERERHREQTEKERRTDGRETERKERGRVRKRKRERREKTRGER